MLRKRGTFTRGAFVPNIIRFGQSWAQEQADGKEAGEAHRMRFFKCDKFFNTGKQTVLGCSRFLLPQNTQQAISRKGTH